jgi:ubiquinol-cytochrome c reductase cytochrome c subunit
MSARPAHAAPEARLRRHRRRAVAAALGLAVLAATSVAARSPDRGAAGAAQVPPTAEVARGRDLYRQGCVSCHGRDGRGVRLGGEERGPSLTDAGEAGAFYFLSTGRMPLNDPDETPHRKRPDYGPAEIDALVAYVAGLGDGPELPEVDVDRGDLAQGGRVFRGNCQACHSASGSGGALNYGRAAPPLQRATPEQVAAAVRSGPGQMPTFGPNEVDQEELDGVVAYVQYLRDPADPGGFAIGRVGPVPEGFVAWGVGVVLLLAAVFWIGTRSPIRRRARP